MLHSLGDFTGWYILFITVCYMMSRYFMLREPEYAMLRYLVLHYVTSLYVTVMSLYLN